MTNGDQGKKYKVYQSVVLIDTGFGMDPQFCTGVLLSRQHILTAIECCPYAQGLVLLRISCLCLLILDCLFLQLHSNVRVRG